MNGSTFDARTLRRPDGTQLDCGCRLEPVDDDSRQPCDLCSEATGAHDGRGWMIWHCKTHGGDE